MDTTANIADVDTGRTVQRVPPLPCPPLTPCDQVEQPCRDSKVLTVRSKKKKRMKPWIGRRGSRGLEEKREGKGRRKERRIRYAERWGREGEEVEGVREGGREGGGQDKGWQHETVGVTQKLRRSSRWARG